MTKTNKIRVAVLYGGRSGEHEVSLVSAANVMQQLDRERFEVVPIAIDKEGGWFLGDDALTKVLQAEEVGRLRADQERVVFLPESISKLPRMQSTGLSQFTMKGEKLFDVVFPVMHGTLCEDGTIQGLLELADVPYVGSGVLASAVGMDKDVSKRLAQNAGINIPDYLVIKRGNWDKNPEQFCDKVSARLTYPVFVKPANTGSSVGVHKVKHKEALRAAIQDAFRYDTKIVVEQGIDAIEIELAVLESLEPGLDPIVSVPGEIRPASSFEFYSYASKYQENGAELIIPAPLSADLQKEVRRIAKDAFLALDCEGMARVDLFLERRTNKIYFNEINTIPGFTEYSMYPRLMAASGISYSELLTQLVMLATKRHAEKNKLNREYLES